MDSKAEIATLRAEARRIQEKLRPLEDNMAKEALKRMEYIKEEISVLVTEAKSCALDANIPFSASGFLKALSEGSSNYTDEYWDSSSAYC